MTHLRTISTIVLIQDRILHFVYLISFLQNENKLLTSEDDRKGSSLELDNPLRLLGGGFPDLIVGDPPGASLMKALCHTFQVTADGELSFR